MNVKQLVDGTSYTYSDSYKTLQRYCKLKGSKLTFFEPKYSNFFLGFYKINCKNRSNPDTNVGVRPDTKTEFNRTVKRS